MAADDELRRRAEEVRELARALRSELRTARWEAKQAARQARHQWHTYYRTGQWSGWSPPGQRPGWWAGWGPPTNGDNGTTVQDRPPPAPAPPVWRPAKPPAPKRSTPKPPIRHRWDGSTLISLLLVVAGLAWLASATHVLSVSLEMVLAVALAILGASMVVTARTDWSLSRRHWPVWLGLLLLVMLVVTADGPNIGDSLSSLHFGPVTSAPAWTTGTVTNFAGPINLDLTTLKAGPAGETLRVRDVFGPINVTVPASPAGYRIHVQGNTVFGPFNVPQRDFGDVGPTLTLDLRGAFGPVNVSTGAAPVPVGPKTPPVP